VRSRFSVSGTVWLVGICRLGFRAGLYGTRRYGTVVNLIQFLAPPLVMNSLT
jgi:hypothetical protein